MSQVKKQIGDQVRITAGEHQDKTGKLIAKNRGSWTVELEDGQQITVAFRMVDLVQSSESEVTAESQSSEQETSVEISDSDQVGEPVEHSDTEVETEQPTDDDGVANSEEQDLNTESVGQDLTKLTVKQLQALAKQRGIGIARTKSDFLRIIKEKNPDEDLDQLVGKVLFNRVKELHISRLRTKEDLIRMLSN